MAVPQRFFLLSFSLILALIRSLSNFARVYSEGRLARNDSYLC